MHVVARAAYKIRDTTKRATNMVSAFLASRRGQSRERKTKTMTKSTRRSVAKLIGATAATSVASAIMPEALFGQARARVSIGTAGRGGFFYPLGTGIAAVLSKYVPGLEAT